jgi:hypothetical protein
MTYNYRDHDFIAYPSSTLPNLETWTMAIGSILVAFGMAYWAHISFAPLAVEVCFDDDTNKQQNRHVPSTI